MLKSYLICGTITILFYAFVFLSFRFSVGKNFIKKYIKMWIIVLIGGAGFFFIFYHLLNQNHFIYYWDYGGYWSASYSLARQMVNDPIQGLISIKNSVLYSDYNTLLPLIITLPLNIFGYQFTTYVLINYVMLLLPAEFILASIVLKTKEKVIGNYSLSWQYAIIVWIILSSFNVLYIPMLMGYIDVGCLIPASLLYLLIINFNALRFDTEQIFRDLLIALNLLLTFLFRRYFAFFAVGLVVALLALTAIQIIQSKQKSSKGINSHLIHPFMSSLFNLAIISGLCLLIMVGFLRPLFNRMLFGGYSNAYSGYDAPLPDKLHQIIDIFGYAVLIIGIIGFVLAYSQKRLRKECLVCLCQLVISYVGFFTVQAMSPQHAYIVTIPLLLLLYNGTYQIYYFILKKTKTSNIALFQRITVIICAIFWGIGTLNCFIPSIRSAQLNETHLYSENYNPLIRNDIPKLKKLAEYINKQTVNSHQFVYILASSGTLNCSILQSLYKPKKDSAISNLYWTYDVDLRDGFNADFFNASLIVTTDPVQTHLATGSQDDITFLANEVTNPYSPIGRHFSKDNISFQLDNHVVVYIYWRKSDYTQADRQYVADYFSKKYPGKNQLFSDRILQK